MTGLKPAEEPVGEARQVGRVEAPVTVVLTPVIGASLRHQTHSSLASAVLETDSDIYGLRGAIQDINVS
ncbi:hypothetical protein ACFYVE_39400 [Streptomyces tendae]|uniref:hypothetical protein n=1 Tax=Streptomyces TaxID=1883 RepID=UPI00368839C5